MTALQRFQSYLEAVERRLRWKALAAGAAILAAAALFATILLSLTADRFAFSEASLFWTRAVLFLSIGLSIVFALAIPILRINRRSTAARVERDVEGLDQRALTLAAAPEENPFSELVAEQALRAAEQTPPSSLVSSRLLGGLAAGCALGIGGLIWLTVAGPGSLGYGAHLLWAGTPRVGEGPMYQIAVKPGDAKVRRGGDQVIEAMLTGFDTPDVRLKARAGSAAQWESLKMEPRPGGGGYAFLFAGIADNVEYMVEAGRLRSPVHRLTVVDMPGVKKLRVTYHYPSWLGLRDATDDPGGDIRAVAGTEADVYVQATAPLKGGLLILDDGTRAELTPEQDNWYKARVSVKKDGIYYVAALDEGTPVRLSEDYFIEAKPEKPPVIRVSRPGKDAKVSPIEEVGVEVHAEDDFGLNSVELKYSVNGGPEQTVALLATKGVKSADGRTMIALEDFKMSPGDVVGIYAAARDARTVTQTDMFFLEAQPFEKEFTQAQSEGGGGGGGEGQQQDEIAQRQKEIIAATWNEIRTPKAKSLAAEDAGFLSGVQQKLSEQAKSLSQRMRSRQLSGTNEEFQKFSKEMDQAAAAMTEATGHLKSQRWRDALAPEQRALQHILRGESIFRQIQVAFGRQGGGGGGGGGGQMRDLESLFDLELDTEKNQYETAQSGGSQQQRERQVDEALKKLEDLARRQQELAQQQQQQKQQQMAQQRWAQEMLRREAEELRKKMEELQRGQQQGQSGQQGQSQGQSQGMSRAQQQLDRAIDDMRKAQQSGQGQSSAENARRAADRMQEARDSMSGMRRQQSGDRIDDISQQTADLAQRQKQFEDQLKQMYPKGPESGQQAGQSREQIEQMAKQKEGMERDWKKLEQQMRETARALEGTQKSAASRMREALGDAQQNELGVRLQQGSGWMRRGLGPYIGSREKVVSDTLDRMKRQVDQAREMTQQQGKPGQGDGKDGRESTEQSVNQLEQLRAQMQAMTRGQQGQQQGQGQGQGQQQGQGQGQEQGQGQGRGQFSGAPRKQSSSRDSSAMNDGTLRGPGGELQGVYDQMMRQLRQFRFGENTDNETKAELDQLIRDMQRLNPRNFPGNPALLGRIDAELLPQVEQIELRLRRKLDNLTPGGTLVRSGSQAGYGDAVAEYFRRLSKEK